MSTSPHGPDGPLRPAPSAPAAVRANGLTKVYGRDHAEIRALDGVTIAFPAGRFTAIMGASGSGKSTLLHCLAGLEEPTSGSVHLTDVDMATLSDAALTTLRRDRIGFVFQAFNLLPTLTAEQNILLPFALAGRRPSRAWFEDVVRVLGLERRLTHMPSALSGGQQQRVAAARALVTRPAVIFADEPTGALDSRSGAELLGLLRTFVRDHGQTVVMVTHDPVAATYADHVVLLRDGRLAAELGAPTADAVQRMLLRLGG